MHDACEHLCMSAPTWECAHRPSSNSAHPRGQRPIGIGIGIGIALGDPIGGLLEVLTDSLRLTCISFVRGCS